MSFPLHGIRRVLALLDRLPPEDRQLVETANELLIRLVELPGSSRATVLAVLRQFSSLPARDQERFLELLAEVNDAERE